MPDRLNAKIFEYLERLNDAPKNEVLEFIKVIHPVENRYTIEQYNKELEEAEAEFERGEYYTHEEAKELFKLNR